MNEIEIGMKSNQSVQYDIHIFVQRRFRTTAEVLSPMERPNDEFGLSSGIWSQLSKTTSLKTTAMSLNYEMEYEPKGIHLQYDDIDREVANVLVRKEEQDMSSRDYSGPPVVQDVDTQDRQGAQNVNTDDTRRHRQTRR